jgi:RNA polymerase sigma factor (TIGR02999 family)
MVLRTTTSRLRARAYTPTMDDPPVPGGASDAGDELEAREGSEAGAATRVLRLAAGGDDDGRRELFGLLEGELRALAGRAMAGEHAGHTLQPTALVGEVWLKLFASDPGAFEGRQHFLAVAARAMRQILVDHARARRRVKRGGEWQRLGIDDVDRIARDAVDDGIDLVELDGVLDELRTLSERQAQVVELRFFAGLEIAEVAEALGTSERTVARDWRFARAWLLKRLEDA